MKFKIHNTDGTLLPEDVLFESFEKCLDDDIPNFFIDTIPNSDISYTLQFNLINTNVVISFVRSVDGSCSLTTSIENDYHTSIKYFDIIDKRVHSEESYFQYSTTTNLYDYRLYDLYFRSLKIMKQRQLKRFKPQ